MAHVHQPNQLTVRQRNNVQLGGRGHRAMVFAHGWGCDQNMWRFVAPAFAEEYRTVLFDHVGAGKSVLSAYEPRKYASLQGYADDLIAVCRDLDCGPVVLVGHSVSAMIGVLAATSAPALFDRLVLVGPSPRYVDDDGYHGGFSHEQITELLSFMDRNYLGWSSAMAPVIMGNDASAELTTELTNSFCRTDPTIAKSFARVTFLSDNREDLPRMSTPSLVLQCRHDIIANESVGRYVNAHLPNSRMTLLQAKGHCPHLSAPKETVAAIRAFLPARANA